MGDPDRATYLAEKYLGVYTTGSPSARIYGQPRPGPYTPCVQRGGSYMLALAHSRLRFNPHGRYLVAEAFIHSNRSSHHFAI